MEQREGKNMVRGNTAGRAAAACLPVLFFGLLTAVLLELRKGLPFHRPSGKLILFMTAVMALSAAVHISRVGERGTGQYLAEEVLGIRRDKLRIVWMDWLRIFAAVMVVAVHSLSAGIDTLRQGGTAPGELLFFMDLIKSCLLCCNTIFIMLSGGLLLGTDAPESLWTFYRKRFIRVLLPCFMYYVFYVFYAYGTARLMPSEWRELFRSFFANDTGLVPHFWLMFVIVAAYLPAPFFSVMVKGMSSSYRNGMAVTILVLHAVYSWAPLFGFSLPYGTFLASWESMFLYGWYLTTEEAYEHRRLILAGGLLGAAFIFLVNCRFGADAAILYNNAPPMLLVGGGIFMLFRVLGSDTPKRSPAAAQVLSRFSFPILLIHWFILFEIVGNKMGITALSYGIGGGVALSVLLTFVFGLLFAILYDGTFVLVADAVISGLFELPALSGRRRKQDA